MPAPTRPPGGPPTQREPRVSVSRSVFALVDERDRTYFGRGTDAEDQIGTIDSSTRAIFGRSYAAEPDVLIEQLRDDEAIAAADTLLLTVPDELGVEYNAHVIEAILTHVAPALGRRRGTPTRPAPAPGSTPRPPWPRARPTSPG